MSSKSVKRLLKKIENFRVKGKNKRRRISGCSEDECGPSSSGVWTPKLFGDYPSSHIYNSTARSQPAELFRKDLISAMKLPDSEPLTPDDYWFISDQWKQEWEKGVQVPVNPDALPEPVVRSKKKEKVSEFKLPKNLIRLTQNDFYSTEIHHLSNVKTLAESVCRYDLDENDATWLTLVNQHFKEQGLPTLKEELMEKIIDELESQCCDNMQEIIQAESGLGIEFDEDVICDVCRSPDSEEGNEMVFCDSCDICVHQACYGITEIPTGSWICRGCDSGLKPSCVLCPNKGGAMKCTRTGQQWVHVSCALWIPEVSIGCVEKMEPITKLANIPQSRWTLVCCVCKEKSGACIQCSIQACKTAYHVTCGFRGGLAMKAIVVNDEHDEDGVKLKSYCPKHTKKGSELGTESDDESSEQQLDKTKDESKDDKNTRMQRLQQIESGFYKYVNLSRVAEKLSVNRELTQYVYYYWKLKRKTAFNKPLLITRSGQIGEQDDGVFARMKMFVQIRQDLERVRNLCYMVSRREKLSCKWHQLREDIFHKQLAVLTDPTLNLSEAEKTSVIHSCHGSSVYDKTYANCYCQAQDDVSAIENECEKLKRSASNSRLPNPYAKQYIISRGCRIARRHSEKVIMDDAYGVRENGSACGESKVNVSQSLSKISSGKNNKFDDDDNASSQGFPATNEQLMDKVQTVDFEQHNAFYPLRASRNRQRNRTPVKSEKVYINGDNESLEELDEEDDNVKKDNHVNENDFNKDADFHNQKKEEEFPENATGRSTKSRKARQKLKPSKGHLKELAGKNNSSEDVSQCRVKQRQESEKIHESLFSTSQKGRLAGYRIPKKPRSELKNENKIADNNDPKQEVLISTATVAHEALPQTSPPKDPRLSSPNFSLQSHSPASPFKAASPQPQQQQQPANSPRSPRNLVPQLLAANTYPPRLVMKLRKDRNCPESQQQWMRASDTTTNVSVYDFPCEQNESPSMQGCVNVSQEPSSSSYFEYSKSKRYSLAVGNSTESQSVDKRINFNNNYTETKPSRTKIVNPVSVHSIQSTYY